MSRHRRVRLLSSLAHSRAWPFVVAKATQVCRRNRNQPGSGLRATALARSDHPTASGESAPSVTLPPTSLPAIVWCGDTPVLQSPDPGTRRSTRATQAQAAPDIHVGQPGTKDRTQREAHGPSQARGVHWGRTIETVVERDSSRFVTIRRATSRFGHFGWPFPSQDGPPEKNYHLESGLNQRDRAECKKRCVGSFPGARSKTATWGVM